MAAHQVVGVVKRIAHATVDVPSGPMEVAVLELDQPDGTTVQVVFPVEDLDDLVTLATQLQDHLGRCRE